MRNFFLVVSLSFLGGILLGQDVSLITDSATARLTRQLALFPQEKIHVQTDKPGYLSGERAWFRVHVVDAMDHRPSFLSRYVYVELFNPFHELVDRVKIRPDSAGVFAGHLDLEEDLPEGEYTLRAYTRYSRNRGEETFPRKTIRVMDPYSLQVEVVPDFTVRENRVEARFRFVDRGSGDTIAPGKVTVRLAGEEARTPREGRDGAFEASFPAARFKRSRALLLGVTRDGRRYNRFYPVPYPAGDFDVTFHPEGGYLVPGRACRVAFKAVDPSGLGEDITGVVYNSRDEKVTAFTSLMMGMGAFSFFPAAGETYHAVCETRDGTVKRVDLPAPEPGARVIGARHARDRVVVSLLEGTAAPGGPVSLLIHNRGVVLYHEPWEAGRDVYAFPESLFPAGVSSILLLDAGLDILSERMVFVMNGDGLARVTGRPSRPSYKRRELVSLALRLEDPDTVTFYNNMAVSVVDAGAVPADSASNLVSALLLSSELRGRVESPARYLSGGVLETGALEALMMTQGWRRYDIPGVLKGEVATPAILPEHFQEVSGTTEAMWLGSMEGGEVSLYAMLDTLHSMETTRADKEGRFLFSVEYPEGTEITVQSLTGKGRRGNFLELDTVTYHDHAFAALGSRGVPGARDKAPAGEAGFDADSYLRQANEEYTRKHGIRTIMLGEVTVTAPAVKPHKESVFYSEIFSVGLMTAEEIKKRKFSSIRQLLFATPGIWVSDDRIMSTRINQELLIVIDDVPMQGIDIFAMDVNDIDNLFVTRSNPILSAFGGFGDALVITTTVGSTEKVQPRNIRRFTPLGYQEPAEFYSPRYETPEAVDSPEPDLRTTIYWKPDVHFSAEGEAVVEFYAADTPGTYRVTGEGVTGSGEIISFNEEIVIESSVK